MLLFSSTAYGFLCWYLPLTMNYTVVAKLTTVVVMHVVALGLASLCIFCEREEQQIKADKQKALLTDIRRIVVEEQQRPGFKCTIDNGSIKVESGK